MKNRIKIISILTIFMIGAVYGIFFHRNKVFPYKYVKSSYLSIHDFINQEKKYGPWSIGVYKGSSPFELTDPTDISNPVLTGKDVTDVDAVFVADPFLITKGKEHFMFFEVLNRSTNHGDIGYAISDDLKTWNYKKIIIDEEFHLSYPFVFEWNDNYYLIPESNQDYSVRLYKATDFPEKWEYVGKLLSGYRNVDNTLFRHNNKWWMFTSTGSSDVLNLHYSDNLTYGWKPHALNPIIKNDKHFSRPSGRVFTYKNKLYRVVQDDEPTYGIQVFAFEIVELSENSYSEKLVSDIPIVKNTGNGWNAIGMHHSDLHQINGEWIAVVDGRK